MSDLISFVTPATGGGGGSNAGVSRASLADNFDTFLTILTAQIQNQDPLEPMDSTQFTQQLVEFSGVEQQIRSNQQLETLIGATRANAGASLAGYLGQTAEIDSAGAQYAGAPVSWRYRLDRSAEAVTISVRDASGGLVYSEDGATTAGGHDFVWSGRGFMGRELPKGAYFLSVAAKDANNADMNAAISLMTRIDGVDLSYGEPALTTAAGVFSYADIKRLIKTSSQ
jgi:flagellar basal-body rod modification protein FlgD